MFIQRLTSIKRKIWSFYEENHTNFPIRSSQNSICYLASYIMWMYPSLSRSSWISHGISVKVAWIKDYANKTVINLFSNQINLSRILEIYPQIDFFALTETHTSEETPDNVYTIPGYTFINRPRTTWKTGGVVF